MEVTRRKSSHCWRNDLELQTERPYITEKVLELEKYIKPNEQVKIIRDHRTLYYAWSIINYGLGKAFLNQISKPKKEHLQIMNFFWVLKYAEWAPGATKWRERIEAAISYIIKNKIQYHNSFKGQLEEIALNICRSRLDALAINSEVTQPINSQTPSQSTMSSKS